ncbi:MAG TPA: thiamine pyrophosphate-binding protein [Bryobacteraceae bacterium]|jgi:acetolactate synthase-1/2/3 large subunit|nr:thiamine pyrophosphate-binding protein [Bryobacteraceae bacterium]
MMKLSDYVIRFLARHGVRHVFLVPGGGAMHLNESLSRSHDIEFVCNLHEQASAIAAENYSKATNHFGVAMLTTGPGATNAITGVAGAWLDSTPCLFISGQVKRADRMITAEGKHLGVRQMGVQEVEIVSLVESIAKYAVTVNDPLEIRYHLEKAVYLAQSGRPGPVWIDIPLDVQAAQIEETQLRGFEPPPSTHSSELLAANVSPVIDALNRAERPLILVGNGVRLSHAEKELRELLAELDIAIETTWLAIDLVDDHHPNFVGRPGAIAPRGANFAIQNCDFLLAIGARLDRILTGYSLENFARGAHKVMVDVDAAEIAKTGDFVAHKICADARDFLHEMLRQRTRIQRRDRSSWLERCQEWKARYPVVLDTHRVAKGPVSVYHFSEVMSEILEPGDLIVSGSSGSAIELFLLAFRVKDKQRVFHTTALGAMGFGIPAAIGACLANGHRRTVCVDGDGGFQFNIQELETVHRLNLPITFFVLNNGGYASIRASQAAFFGQPRIGADTATGQSLPDVRRVAEAYGIKTDLIPDQSNLRFDIERVLARSGPIVCEVRVISDEVRQPRITSVQNSDGSFLSTPLEDLWPFLEREEFASNVLIPALQSC